MYVFTLANLFSQLYLGQTLEANLSLSIALRYSGFANKANVVYKTAVDNAWVEQNRDYAEEINIILCNHIQPIFYIYLRK